MVCLSLQIADLLQLLEAEDELDMQLQNNFVPPSYLERLARVEASNKTHRNVLKLVIQHVANSETKHWATYAGGVLCVTAVGAIGAWATGSVVLPGALLAGTASLAYIFGEYIGKPGLKLLRQSGQTTVVVAKSTTRFLWRSRNQGPGFHRVGAGRR